MNKALDVTLLGLSASHTHQVLKQLYWLMPNIRFSEEGLDETERIDISDTSDDHELQDIIMRIFKNENKIYALIAAYLDAPELLGVFTGVTKKLMPPYNEYYQDFDSKTVLKKLLKDSGSSDFYFIIFDKKYIKDRKEQYQRFKNKNLPVVKRELDKQKLKRTIAFTVNKLELLAKDTDFEYDNFLKVADNVLRKSKTADEVRKNINKLPYALQLFSTTSKKERDFSDAFKSLVDHLAELKYPHLSNMFSLQNMQTAEAAYNEVAKIKNYDYYTLELDDIKWSYKDASGYTVDLARYLKKKIQLNEATPERLTSRAEKTYQDYENFLNWLKPKLDKMYQDKEFDQIAKLTQSLKELHDMFLTAESHTNSLQDGETFGDDIITQIFGLWMNLSQEIYSIKQFIINN